jgi:zinc and cadmium transporter
MPWLLLTVYCTLILLASLAGGLIPLLIHLSHRRMQIAVSLVAGVMLGVGLLHMLPHALIEAPGAVHTVFLWVLAGFLAMFFIERFFCYHHHELPSEEDIHHDETCTDEKCLGAGCHEGTHRITWSGAAVGLTLHSVIAGVALAASVTFAARDGLHASTLAGFGAFLVIFLHKPFDALTIGTLMSIGGWSTFARHAVNGLFALMVPLGVILFQLGIGHTDGSNQVLAYALAFSAGTFLCVSMSDLLPELQFHSHDRAMLSTALVAGLSLAWAAGLLETCGHQHNSPECETHEESQPNTHNHQH